MALHPVFAGMQRTRTRFLRSLALLLSAASLLPAGFLGGCSTSRLASRAMIPIIENTRDFALSYPDVETFLAATPSNLFLIEGMIESDRGNDKLRITASMLYFSYGFTKIEDRDPGYASFLYLKGLEHASAVLKKDAAVREGWNGRLDEFESICGRIEAGDVEALTWAAANWAQFISLHLDSTAVLPDIPRVTALLERSRELDEAYFMGLSHITLGILHAFRPPMLGGDPARSLENFTRAFELSQNNFFLCHYFYAKYYCYRTQDAAAFEDTLTAIIGRSAAAAPRYRLLNEIARQKARHLLEEKDELF